MPLLLADLIYSRDCKLNLRKNVDTTLLRNADHIANANHLKPSRARQLINRSAVDIQNGFDITFGISSVLCSLFFLRGIVVHKNFLSIC